MAYASMAVYAAAFTAGLVRDEWPLWKSSVLTFCAISYGWGVTLFFVKFQLNRRRWAALRIAGMEGLLAKWIREPPSSQDLETKQLSDSTVPGWRDCLLDYLWPRQGAVLSGDVTQEVYPSSLVNIWQTQNRLGTGAIRHEIILVTFVGWGLYLALLARTLAPYLE